MSKPPGVPKVDPDSPVELSKRPKNAETFRSPSSDSRPGIVDTVPVHYRGTPLDHDDMLALGKTQVLRRNFRLLGIVAFANSVMVMWETFLIVSGLGLSVGGRAPVFWGLIYGSVAMTCVYVVVAEMARLMPTAGGWWLCFVSVALCLLLGRWTDPL